MTPTLTEPDLDALPAGREMDAFVAVEVLGWEWRVWDRKAYERHHLSYPSHAEDRVRVLCHPEAGNHPELMPLAQGWEKPRIGSHVPQFSTKIGDAWQVVEQMAQLKFSCVLGSNCHAPEQNGCKFFEGWRGLGHSLFSAGKTEGFWDVADTVPLAICRAGLKAVRASR